MKRGYLKKGMFSFFNSAMLIAFLLAIVCLPNHTAAQSRPPGDVSITGTVKDNLGKPIEGATIRVIGKNVTATSDERGAYSITANPKGSIEISRVGYKPQTIALKNTIVWDVVLEASQGSENEVVVIGYGTQKAKDVTSSIATVSLAETRERPVVKCNAGIGRKGCRCASAAV